MAGTHVVHSAGSRCCAAVASCDGKSWASGTAPTAGGRPAAEGAAGWRLQQRPPRPPARERTRRRGKWRCYRSVNRRSRHSGAPRAIDSAAGADAGAVVVAGDVAGDAAAVAVAGRPAVAGVAAAADGDAMVDRADC